MGYRMLSSEFEVPKQWYAVNTKQLSGTTIVIGPPDSGKSTLVQWLVKHLSQTYPTVGWLDGDIGQTTLGVPTTMNLALLERAKDQMLRPLATIFVGSTSPRGHMDVLLDGLHRLQKLALVTSASAMVVDTTGMIDAHSGGSLLKKKKIELLQPSTIIALQRQQELEHIITPLQTEQRYNIYLFNPAEAVIRKSPEKRALRRRIRFQRYFQYAIQHQIQHDALPVFGQTRPATMLLMAFMDKMGFALALGVVLSISSESMEIMTPLSDLSQVAGLRFGDLRLDPRTGNEI